MSDDERTFRVVVNHEEQYSVWPGHKDVPEGWVAVGPEGSKERCLDYIERIWTDMRPRSLRMEMLPADEESSGSRSVGGVDEELQTMIDRVVDRTLSEYEDRVDEYAEGRPELFGWFLARVFEKVEDKEVDPDTVRSRLDAQLPSTYVSDDYA